MQKQKVIVTGGAGFIGSNLTDALVERGFDVQVVDNLVGGKREHVNKKATLHEADIRDVEALKPIFKGASCVFHLAALPRVQFSIEHPIESNETNVIGTLNVLVAAKEAGVRRVVYSASSSAYGDQEKLPVTEDMPAMPKSPYGLQKYVGELYCRVWNEIYGLETVSLRYFNVYGNRQSEEGAYALVIAKFMKQKREGKPFTITGDGEQTRDFTHVRDVVAANLLAMESAKVGKSEVINIGAGRNVSVNTIAKLIGGPVEHIAARQEIRHNRADHRLAKRLLGWEPTIAVEEGIKELMR
ncbi:NAD-dependent epimerase/dehydratase family protein [Candidatus Parcubacteria bacterium]|nr:NAD-dependent epimerase/dehydratase family protein [Candidatus Parcubacteria bacterium]